MPPPQAEPVQEAFVAAPKQRKRRERKIEDIPDQVQLRPNENILSPNNAGGGFQQQFNQIQTPPQYGGYPQQAYNQQQFMQQQYPLQPFQVMQQPIIQPSVDSEISKIRSEIQNQHQVLAKQLEEIKREANNAMEERNKAEMELLKLRDQLKKKMVSEELYKHNLRSALEKNSELKIANINNQLISDNMPPIGAGPYDMGFLKKKPPLPQRNPLEMNLKDVNFSKQIFSIKNDNRIMNERMDQRPKLDDTMDFDINRTLAHETKLIPLAAFDGNQAENQTNLTLSKLQNYAIRPNSSSVWDKQNDALDNFVNKHQNRPISSEMSRDLTSTKIIGKNLDEANAILQNYDTTNNGLSTTTKILSKWQAKGKNADTLSLAARNILAKPTPEDDYGRDLDLGANQVFGREPESNAYLNAAPRSRLQSRMNEPTRMVEPSRPDFGTNDYNGLTSNTDLFGKDPSYKGFDGIQLGKEDGFDDKSQFNLSDAAHNLSHGESTFNLERINMQNEARLKNLENFGNVGSQGNLLGNKGNYYHNNSNHKLLETIREDDDNADELAKLDKLLLNYMK